MGNRLYLEIDKPATTTAASTGESPGSFGLYRPLMESPNIRELLIDNLDSFSINAIFKVVFRLAKEADCSQVVLSLILNIPPHLRPVLRPETVLSDPEKTLVIGDIALQRQKGLQVVAFGKLANDPQGSEQYLGDFSEKLEAGASLIQLALLMVMAGADGIYFTIDLEAQAGSASDH